MAIFEEKERKVQHEKLLKSENNEHKAYIDQNLKVNRKIEKEKILHPKKRESENIQLNSLKKQLIDRNKSMFVYYI